LNNVMQKADLIQTQRSAFGGYKQQPSLLALGFRTGAPENTHSISASGASAPGADGSRLTRNRICRVTGEFEKAVEHAAEAVIPAPKLVGRWLFFLLSKFPKSRHPIGNRQGCWG
jgi:hypothetical protein